jgi:hypothetical protein
MSWQDILKNDDGHDRVLQLAQEVLRELGVKDYKTLGAWLASSEHLYSHIPSNIWENDSEEELNRQVTKESLISLAKKNKEIYLPHTLDKDERFTSDKRMTWEEDGHEITWELIEALEAGVQLPEWAVVENNKISMKKTGKKFIEEATRENRHWNAQDMEESK